MWIWTCYDVHVEIRRQVSFSCQVGLWLNIGPHLPVGHLTNPVLPFVCDLVLAARKDFFFWNLLRPPFLFCCFVFGAECHVSQVGFWLSISEDDDSWSSSIYLPSAYWCRRATLGVIPQLPCLFVCLFLRWGLKVCQVELAVCLLSPKIPPVSASQFWDYKYLCLSVTMAALFLYCLVSSGYLSSLSCVYKASTLLTETSALNSN